MTPAERQRRLSREKSVELKQRERLKRREKNLRDFIPMPPGITYWREVTIHAGTERRIRQPITRPLAACETDLDDEEILGLIIQLHKIARNRNITIPVDDGNGADQ